MPHLSRRKMTLLLLASCLAISCITTAPAYAASRTGDAMFTMSGQSSYAMVVHGHESVFVSGSGDSNAQLDSLRKSVHGDFLWFRDAGKAYLIQDPATLARATANWQPMEKMSAQMAVYGGQMSEYSNAMVALDKKRTAASGSAAEMQAISGQMHANSKAMGALGMQMGELGKQQEAVSKQVDAGMRALLQQALKNGKALPAPASAG